MKLLSDTYPPEILSDFAVVEECLREVNALEQQTFFILEDIDDSFVQVACDGGQYVIEKKDKAHRELHRAYSKEKFGTINTQRLRVTQFKIMALGDELLTLEQV